jgi:hypothetical protein
MQMAALSSPSRVIPPQRNQFHVECAVIGCGRTPFRGETLCGIHREQERAGFITAWKGKGGIPGTELVRMERGSIPPMRNYIGVYQRPVPPKRPLGLHAPSVHTPVTAICEIRAQAAAIELAALEKRKRGRPTVNARPMTPAERQARRRENQRREEGIKEARRITDFTGKLHGEAKSGGYDSTKIDIVYGARSTEVDYGGAHRGRQVCPGGASPKTDERDHGEVFSAGGSYHRAGGYVEAQTPAMDVCGPEPGDKASNRRRFAGEQLGKMVDVHFDSLVRETPHWISRHHGNATSQSIERPVITLTCKLCGDSMDAIADAIDHLRVDHRKTINEWFACVELPSQFGGTQSFEMEFRDMGRYVTYIVRRKCTKSLDSESCKPPKAA